MVSYVQLSMVRFFKVVHCFSALRSAQLIWSTATERLSSDLVAYDISIGWLLVALYSLHGLLMFPHLSFVTPIFFPYTRQTFLRGIQISWSSSAAILFS